MIVKPIIQNIKLLNAEAVYAKKKEVADAIYLGRCFCCEKPYQSGFAFHHKEYDPARKTHKDFKNTVEYNRYVIPEVISFPFRFRLLCKVCHARIDQPRLGYLGHMKKDKLIRLFMAAFETKGKPRKNGGDSVASSNSECLENKKELDACTIDELNNLKSFLVGYSK